MFQAFFRAFTAPTSRDLRVDLHKKGKPPIAPWRADPSEISVGRFL
jgi:hypothetical protein